VRRIELIRSYNQTAIGCMTEATTILTRAGGAGIGVLFLLVAAFNFVVWYGALLTSPAAQQAGGFLHWWSGRPLLLRAAIALFLILLPIGLLVAER
jgi:hypothetical protein